MRRLRRASILLLPFVLWMGVGCSGKASADPPTRGTLALTSAPGDVFVRPEELDIPLTLEGARAANATLGSGVVLVFDDTVDMNGILLRIAAFFRDESCGQCVPCRVGTVRQEEALHRLIAADGSRDTEIALLAELEQVMKDASICGLGQTAAGAISSAIHRLGMFHGDPQGGQQ